MTSWESQVDAFKSAIKFGGRNSIDIVYAGAGVPGVPFVDSDEEAPSLEKDPPKPPMVDAVYNVNAKGVYLTCKLAQHYFRLANEGEQPQPYKKVLIMVSSLAGYFEINAVEYTSTKWVRSPSIICIRLFFNLESKTVNGWLRSPRCLAAF